MHNCSFYGNRIVPKIGVDICASSIVVRGFLHIGHGLYIMGSRICVDFSRHPLHIYWTNWKSSSNFHVLGKWYVYFMMQVSMLSAGSLPILRNSLVERMPRPLETLWKWSNGTSFTRPTFTMRLICAILPNLGSSTSSKSSSYKFQSIKGRTSE